MSTDSLKIRIVFSTLTKFRLPILMSAVLALCAAMLSPDANAGIYRAFYYDDDGLLLQVEDVPDGEYTSRKLVDVDSSLMAIPMLTNNVRPLITGANILMSRFATIAVYYTYANPRPGDGTPNVIARPAKIEYLGFVKERTIKLCVARAPDAPCQFPKRCHCMTTSCCCY